MDEYLNDSQDRGEALWEVRLSDGTLAYCDDGRPGTEGSSWLRLKSKCDAEGVVAVGMRLLFRGNQWELPGGERGYFFCKGCLKDIGSETTFRYYVVGWVEDGAVKVQKICVPALSFVSEESRTLAECEEFLVPGASRDGPQVLAESEPAS